MSGTAPTLEELSPILTEDILNEHLTKWFRRQVTYVKWKYVGGTGKGDSFLGDVKRVQIFAKDLSGKEECVQIVLKSMPTNQSCRLTFRMDELFKNEINFYHYVLPALLKFQEKKNVQAPFKQYASLVFANSDGISDALALEDVTLKNYTSAIRQEGASYDHCKVVMRTYAKFHAISFAIKDQEPDVFYKLQNCITEVYIRRDLWGWYEDFWKRMCDIAVDNVEKEYPDSIYLEKVKGFATPETYQRLCEATSNQENGVISHGDAWINNILFECQDSTLPIDAKLIDFQMTRCASPVLDVVFFIYTSTLQDLRKQHYGDILKCYHDELTKQIKELGSDPEKLYPWDTFMGEIKKYSFFGLAISFEATPFIVLDPEDAPNMEMQGDEKVNINEVWTVQRLKTREARLRGADIVVHCVDNGYI